MLVYTDHLQNWLDANKLIYLYHVFRDYTDKINVTFVMS